MGGTRATFRKLSRVSSNQRVKEPYCSFPGAKGDAQRCRRDPEHAEPPPGKGAVAHWSQLLPTAAPVRPEENQLGPPEAQEYFNLLKQAEVSFYSERTD